MKRWLLIAGAAVAVVLVVLLTRGEDKYTVELRLANAQGLRPGSPVVVGGVRVGNVRLDVEGDAVAVMLDIERNYAPIGRDASASVTAQNLLGQKQVTLEPGDTDDEAPDGYKIPARQIEETADLDDLLNALDPDTRARLAVVLSEAGATFAGREMDLKRLLDDLAPALSSGGDVLAELTRDNRALTNLLDASDRWVAEVAGERRRITRMIDTLGGAAETVAERRGALRETLRRAPSSMRTTRSFMGELRAALGPLAATSRQIAATSPSLRLALDRLEPFRRDAKPALDVATSTTAPGLGAMADDGTRGLRRAVSVFGRLRQAAENELPPVGGTLDQSMDNLLAVVDNWSRAIQYSDGLSHIFRGEATIGSDLYESVLRRLAPPSRRQPDKRTPARPAKPGPGKPPARPQVTMPARPQLPQLGDLPQQLTDTLRETIEGLLGGLGAAPKPGAGKPPATESDLAPLLDYLLGQ